MILIFVCIFISNYGIITQALVVFLIMIIFLVLNSRKKPFVNDSFYDLETLSLITSIVTVYCGLFYIADTGNYSNSDSPFVDRYLALGEGSKTFFFIAIIMSNLLFFVYWGYKVIFEIRKILLKECPRTYFYLCSCMDKDRQEYEAQKRLVIDENEVLKEEYMKGKLNILVLTFYISFEITKRHLQLR